MLTRDRPREFALALRALAQQRFRDFELIVVGALGSAEAHGAPAALARRLAYISCGPENISMSRNYGLAHARGRIVAFIDDDAAPEPDWLERLLPAFAAPDVGAAGGFVRGRNGVAFQWRGALVDRYGAHRPLGDGDLARSDHGADGAETFVSTLGCNSAFRREALEAAGGFDENYRYFLDESDLCLRLAAAGWRTVLVPAAEVHHAYSASPERFANRAPRDLFEIAASHVYFGRMHGDPAWFDRHLARFREEQAERLKKYVQLGRLSRRHAARILERMEAGLADGEARAAATEGRPWPRAPRRAAPPCRPADGPFIEPDPPVRPRYAVLAGRLSRRRALGAARRLAAAGAEVTLVDFTAPFGRLSVAFDGAIWTHAGGALGRESFDAPAPPLGRAARAAREIGRVSPRRQFDAVIRPQGAAWRVGLLRPAPLRGVFAGYVAEPLRAGAEAAALAALEAAGAEA